MLDEIWDLVDGLVDSRCEYEKKEYLTDIKDIENEIQSLASKIEQDKEDEFEYFSSGDAKLDHDCDKAGV